MNGLQIIDLKKASFMDRLLKREPRENAFVEINNLLACVPILNLDKDSIERLLQKHNVPRGNARPRLLNFYAIILKDFLRNLNLNNQELENLHHLRNIFSLELQEVGSIHRQIIHPIYKMHIRQIISDGNLSEQEKEKLKQIAERLYIPKEFAEKLYINEASAYLHSVLDKSIANGMLSDKEELELERLAKNLQVELTFSENARKNLERCRYLWKLYIGELPIVKTPVRLGKDENCAGFVKAMMYQVNNSRVPVRYSGYHELRGQEDFGFHSGTFNKDVVVGKTITFIDQGTLYLTNCRLLFSGTNGEKYYLYKNLSGGTFYKNGFLVEQRRGTDMFFKFDGDIQAIKLIFDTLMTKTQR